MMDSLILHCAGSVAFVVCCAYAGLGAADALHSIQDSDLHHCFRVVSISVQDRDSQAPCYVGAVRTGPPIAGRRGEADLQHMHGFAFTTLDTGSDGEHLMVQSAACLIVDDNVDAAACRIACTMRRRTFHPRSSGAHMHMPYVLRSDPLVPVPSILLRCS